MKNYKDRFAEFPMNLEEKKEIAKAIDMGYKFDYSEMPSPLNELVTTNSLPFTRSDVANLYISQVLSARGYKIIRRKITSHQFIICVNDESKHAFVFLKKLELKRQKIPKEKTQTKEHTFTACLYTIVNIRKHQ